MKKLLVEILAKPLAVGVLALAAGAAWAEPTLVAEETAVVFASETRGAGESVWLVLMREHENHITVESRDAQVVLDEERQGTFRYELGRPLPPQSLFVAVELDGGAAAVLELLPDEPPAEGEEAIERRRPTGVAVTSGSPSVLVTASEGGLLTLFVRPNGGAWTSSVADGAHGDDDLEADGVVSVGLARLLLEELRAPGLGGSVPESFEPGDIVVLVDPDALTASVTRLEPEDFAVQR